MKVAIQGNAGSFHDQAARQYFDDSYELIACSTFRDVFDAVSTGQSEYGIVAIENSLHGSINPVYRLLADRKLWVCGEIRLHIQLYLIGSAKNEQGNYGKITKIVSQAEALSQCELWLHDNLPHALIEETNDTAGSVLRVMENNVVNTAAVAGQYAAKKYAGTMLAGPINDDPENYTRFFVLTNHPVKNTQPNRTSIVITEKYTDRAGSLYDALGVFKKHEINLSKLDSHTLPGKVRSYAFYIDYDEYYYSGNSLTAIAELQSAGWNVAILGTYEKSEH